MERLDPTTQDLVRLALAEDIGSGDVTSSYFVAASARSRGRVVAREAAVLSGVEVAAAVFREVDASIEVECLRGSGDALEAGDVALEVRGPSRAVLTAERTALNFLQRLSGVATLTREFVRAVAGHGAEILDTRKTTPGWRALEKRAVRDGGGRNHRMGLYDMAMVKDNHLLALGGAAALQGAVERLASERPDVQVEVEVDTLEQLAVVLGLRGVAFVLLDNMSLDELREAVAMRDASGAGVLLEASGGVNLDTVGGIAATGVDLISVGALTHSSPAVDLSLEFDPGADGDGGR